MVLLTLSQCHTTTLWERKNNVATTSFVTLHLRLHDVATTSFVTLHLRLHDVATSFVALHLRLHDVATTSFVALHLRLHDVTSTTYFYCLCLLPPLLHRFLLMLFVTLQIGYNVTSI